MTKTETAAVLDVCQAIAAGAILEGQPANVAGAVEAELEFQLALTSETLNAGLSLIVQTSSELEGDEDWIRYWPGSALQATAASEVITNNPAPVGTTVFTVASTTGFTGRGLRFLQDITTFVNSEWLWQTGSVLNTSITVMDATKRAHAQNSTLYTGAESRRIMLPEGIKRVRTIYDNGAGASTVAIRSRIVTVTIT